MKLQPLRLALLLVGCLATVSSVSPMRIYPDNPKMDNRGYSCGPMEVNGEHLVARTYIRSGDVVFDVGANIGDWSTLVTKAHPQVTIYAFEPHPEASVYYKKRMAQYTTLLFPTALSDKEGVRSFVLYRKNEPERDLDGSSKSSFFRREIVENGRWPHSFSRTTVNTMSLDQFCELHKIDHIDFLKIDTEGSENQILRGARNLLANKRITHIQFEYGSTYADAKETLYDAYRLLTSHEYSVFRILPNGLLQIKRWHRRLEKYKYSNYFVSLNASLSKKS